MKLAALLTTVFNTLKLIAKELKNSYTQFAQGCQGYN